MSFRHLFSWAIASASLFATFAQGQSALSSLPPDHYDVYNAFFQDHVAWQAALAATPGSSALLNAGITQMHISASQATFVAQTANQAVSNVNALAAQKANYLAATPKPNAHELNQLEIQRREAIMLAVSQLMKTLPLGSWHGLHWYINGPMRVGGVVLPKGGK